MLAQPLGPRYIGQVAVEDRFHQRIASRDHVADHEQVRLEGDLRRVEAFDQFDALGLQLRAHGRVDVGVAAGHAVAGLLQHGQPPMKVPQMPRMWICMESGIAWAGAGAGRSAIVPERLRASLHCGIRIDPDGPPHDSGRRGRLRYHRGMPRRLPSDPAHLREEIAQAAARMIAEDGADYATAKRKAVRRCWRRTRGRRVAARQRYGGRGSARLPCALPQRQPTAHPALLRRPCWPWPSWRASAPTVGAALNGTATEHSDVYLQCFCDSPKDVALHLLNAGVDFETSETRHFAGRGEVETQLPVARPVAGEPRDARAVGRGARGARHAGRHPYSTV